MTIEIKDRWTGRVLYTAQVESVREAVEAAVRAGANLTYADLAGASRTGACLTGAHLEGAALAGANLAGADLTGAHLEGAYLAGANLARAHLEGAHLEGAIVVGDWARAIREDIRAVLDAAPAEVPALLAALWAGRVDGSTYSGECACLVGTIANVRGVEYDTMPTLRPNSTRPAERWFLQIRKGDTPVTNPSAAFAAAVIAQWIHEREARKGKRRRTKREPAAR